MKNYLKSLFSMSLLALNAEAAKEDKKANTEKHSSLLLAGGFGGTYYFSVGETFKVGPSASVLYAHKQGVKGLVGVDAKIGLEMGFVKGLHLSANLMIAGRAPELNLTESSFGEKQKEIAKKMAEATKSSMFDFLNGFNFMFGVDVPYAFIGIYAEYASAHALLKKNATVGLVIAPTLAVPGMESLELRAFLIGGKSFGKRELKLTREQILEKAKVEGATDDDYEKVKTVAKDSDYAKAMEQATRFIPETEDEKKAREAAEKKTEADKVEANKVEADKVEADKAKKN